MALAKTQRFTIANIHRSKIQNAEYNPRTMDKEAKKRLKNTLKELGLVEPLIWNKRTGNLVGGHQRLEQIDALEKSDDYELTVSVVDLDEETEVKVNLALNNLSIQGQYDMERVAMLVESYDLDLLNIGFTSDDLNIMSANTGFDFVKEAPPEIILDTMTDEERALKEAERLAKKDEQYHKTMEKRKEHIAESMDEVAEEQNAFFVVRFRTLEEKFQMMDKLQLDRKTDIVSPEILYKFIK